MSIFNHFIFYIKIINIHIVFLELFHHICLRLGRLVLFGTTVVLDHRLSLVSFATTTCVLSNNPKGVVVVVNERITKE